MKAISITSIICGTSLILAPIINNIVMTTAMARLLAETRERVSITGTLDNSYNPWCMFLGFCVIVSGLLIGLRSRNTIEQTRVTATVVNPTPSHA